MLVASISAAIGAILSAAKRAVVARIASAVSPNPKSIDNADMPATASLLLVRSMLLRPIPIIKLKDRGHSHSLYL